ncbi:MAG: hypothetical protein HYY22_00475 [Thaumarchaeota archaeon]|nr:hypothetical protein [Nitrososphaerota archaeon]
MEKLVKADLEIERKMVPKQLPKVMYLCAVDLDHFVISAKKDDAMADKALVKAEVQVLPKEDGFVLKLPRRIFEFYRLEENDYTLIVSEKEPTSIVVAV